MKGGGSSKSASLPNKKLPNKVSQNILSREIVQTYIVIPPDGGWGWLVTLTSFITNFTADGTMYTFGVFIADVSDSVGSTPAKVVIANSLMTGFYYVAGPMISALTNAYGYRPVAMVGGVISSIAILVTSYTHTLYTVLFVYGVLGGIGFGMMYVPSIVVIGFYFERWRAMATSIAVCGSSLGIILFPIVFKQILNNMEWRVKFRILSGMCLMCTFLSILYRPLQPVLVVTGIDGTVSVVNNSSVGTWSSYNSRKYTGDLYRGSMTSVRVPNTASSMSVFINTTNPTTTKSFVRTKVADTSRSKTSIIPLERICEEDEEEYVDKKCKNCFTACKKRCSCDCSRNIEQPIRLLYRDDIFYSGSLALLPEYISSHNTAARSFPNRASLEYRVSVTRTLPEQEDKMSSGCCPSSIKHTLSAMLDLSLLKTPSFLLLAFSGLFTTLGLYTPFLFIAENATENGYDTVTAYYLLSTLGFSNTVGRIACGIFSSLPHINPLMCSHVSLTICGLTTLASPFSYQKVWQFGFATIFGFTVACISALRSVIIAEMVGLEKLTNGFGLCLLFQGVSCLIGVPISGFLRNWSGSYALSFYFAGSAILLSAILLMILEVLLKYEKNKQTGNA